MDGAILQRFAITLAVFGAVLFFADSVIGILFVAFAVVLAVIPVFEEIRDHFEPHLPERRNTEDQN
ncbi:hypothetical protein E6P09_08065 [Haloferax mediterranei ATCC 33500]|nr:hypothetical protein [Haloferax mediterranei]AFK18723.1 hypothetical protein HFX_1005 [Haloferax mediterranei ATCC 33500]AHZ21909.1 hypothetical protein BM92_04190 [Haloferax mediterranei ATCC 33500]MDX5988819.1 hypothetical protein [Haloferax mediterranei ATCC 33500]QCQ75222.1 hypothetical protein E6P09_08065 [Haloferax mediterranei ATCC 33500]